MKIVCPTCATSYQVSAASIGATGRSVRCTRCRAIWVASAAEALEAAADAIAPETAASSDAAVAAFRQELGPPAATPAAPDPDTTPPPGPAVAPAELPKPADIETAAAAASESEQPVELSAGQPAENEEPPAVVEAPPLVPALPEGEFPPAASPDEAVMAARRRRRGRRPPARQKPRANPFLLVTIAALAAVIAALIALRAEVVRHAPQMASLYSRIGLTVNLRKLVFTEVRLAKEVHDGVPVLMVEGTIASTSPKPIEVPRLRFAVRNAAGTEVYAWTAPPSQPQLGAFEQLAFTGRLASPPGDGRDVVVRFFNRHDTIANPN